MGLSDTYNENTNHAEEFKTAYMDRDMDKITSVLLDWLDNGRRDALFGLAMVILVATRRDKSISEAMEIYQSSIRQGHDDSILFDWYKNTALRLLDSWAEEEISAGHDSKVASTGDSPKNTASTNFEQLRCDEFAREFKALYDQLSESDVNQMEDIISKLKQILVVWDRKCPDDSNYACAYVMVHAPELNQDDLSDYVFRYASGTVADESLKEWYQDGLAMAIKAIEAMNK